MRAIGSDAVHQVIVTAPLGLVPRELEEIWPAANYDIPVTGEWDADELAELNSYCGIDGLLLFLGDLYRGPPEKSCPDPDGKNSSVELN